MLKAHRNHPKRVASTNVYHHAGVQNKPSISVVRPSTITSVPAAANGATPITLAGQTHAAAPAGSLETGTTTIYLPYINAVRNFTLYWLRSSIFFFPSKCLLHSICIFSGKRQLRLFFYFKNKWSNSGVFFLSSSNIHFFKMNRFYSDLIFPGIGKCRLFFYFKNKFDQHFSTAFNCLLRILTFFNFEYHFSGKMTKLCSKLFFNFRFFRELANVDFKNYQHFSTAFLFASNILFFFLLFEYHFSGNWQTIVNFCFNFRNKCSNSPRSSEWARPLTNADERPLPVRIPDRTTRRWPSSSIHGSTVAATVRNTLVWNWRRRNGSCVKRKTFRCQPITRWPRRKSATWSGSGGKSVTNSQRKTHGSGRKNTWRTWKRGPCAAPKKTPNWSRNSMYWRHKTRRWSDNSNVCIRSSSIGAASTPPTPWLKPPWDTRDRRRPPSWFYFSPPPFFSSPEWSKTLVSPFFFEWRCDFP